MIHKKEPTENKRFAGKHHSSDSIRLITKNHARYWKGKIFTPEHRAKIACSRHTNLSKRSIQYQIYNLIIKRDMNTCKICGKVRGILRDIKKKGAREGNLTILHKDGNKDNLSPANLLTVCYTCHQGLK